MCATIFNENIYFTSGRKLLNLSKYRAYGRWAGGTEGGGRIGGGGTPMISCVKQVRLCLAMLGFTTRLFTQTYN